MALPQFLPLPAAAKRLGLTETELRARVKAGTIAAGVLPDGEVIVNTDVNDQPTDDINARLRAIRREDFEHLRGMAISVTEAAEKYGVNRMALLRWVKKGYIRLRTRKLTQVATLTKTEFLP
jgi:predicted site-specific integrase-resolvase